MGPTMQRAHSKTDHGENRAMPIANVHSRPGQWQQQKGIKAVIAKKGQSCFC